MALSISPDQLTTRTQQELRPNNPPPAKNVRVASQGSSDTDVHVTASGSASGAAKVAGVQEGGWGFPAIRDTPEAAQAASAASAIIAQQPVAAAQAQANSSPHAVLAMLRG